MAKEQRLIHADALIKSMREEDRLFPDVPWSTTGVQKQIDELPTVDAVEVVRCKDCNHYKNGSCNIHSVWPYQYSPGYDFRPDDDDFCSYGERKNNG